MPNRAEWTQEELVALAAAALSGPAYPGAPNGRVRDVPDRRTVRWYTTIGLVDRPAATRGRTALYGPRHLLQIVAIKRLQAQGHSIAEIQEELVGATDATLRHIAAVADDVLAAEPSELPAGAPIDRGRFWAQAPATATAAPLSVGGDSVSVTVRAAVDLPGGAVLLVHGRPSDDDLAAIGKAAQPLLDLLAERGLLDHGKQEK